MADLGFFTLNIENKIAHLALNGPEKANSMNSAFWLELPKVISELDNNPEVRALVISGEGKHFSSGIDLSVFESFFTMMQAEPSRAAIAARKEILRLQEAFNTLERARFPVIAAVHGVCMGGGVDMICACDLRLASEDTQFSIEEINIGMAADVGTLQRLPKLIPPTIAKELAYTGRVFSAKEALSWGFINAIHSNRENCLNAAMELAGHIAQKSPAAVAGTKQAINYGRDHSVADGLEQIATWNGGALRPKDLLCSIEARKNKKMAEYDDLLPSSGSDTENQALR